MQYKITSPTKIKSVVQLPSSKSISNRGLILNALSLNTEPIINLSDCEDTQVIIDAFNSDSNIFDVKAAGTAMRFLTAFLAGMEGEWIIKGTHRMHERPIFPLVDTLLSLGASIKYIEKEGYPPIKIKGRQMKGGEVNLSGSISSQFISALLMIAPLMESGLTIHIKNEIISKPYIDLTLNMMRKYGINAIWCENSIKIKHKRYKPFSLTVESDWSAASYWYEMVALLPGSQVKLIGLEKESMQGDSKTAELFEYMGVTTKYLPDGVFISKTKQATDRFFYDFVNEPDLAQTFIATCCFLNIRFVFSGLQSLKIKETDRINAMITEMQKFGFILQAQKNSILSWGGERCDAETNPVIHTYDDHRMAMALAPASIVYKSTLINNPEVVSKSYPNFWNDLRSVGFEVEEVS
ncbi:MAG: 3-phosphoshikimate 1-carboxyvinyltransferase [Dysgonamonadaceae bacterium]|nr:3-phosphoshikimate 1-carboxyvinyltransferase [Dysgonamonadaceae bacterium]